MSHCSKCFESTNCPTCDSSKNMDISVLPTAGQILDAMIDYGEAITIREVLKTTIDHELFGKKLKVNRCWEYPNRIENDWADLNCDCFVCITED